MPVRIRRSVGLAAVLVLLSLAMLASEAIAAPTYDGHFKVGTFNTNSKIVEGPDHNMWLTIEAGGKDVARITPDGQVQEFEIEGVTQPSGIAVGPEGRIWVTQDEGVESFPPADPEKNNTGATIPDVKSPASIVAGPDGQMWVATTKNLVHFKPSEPDKAKSIEVEDLSPKDIDVAGSNLVIADAGKPRILVYTTAGTLVTDYPIAGSSQGVAGNAAGQIGFSQQAKEPEQVGVITPPNAPILTNTPAVDPFGVTFGIDGAVWAARKGGAERVTPAGEASFIGGPETKFFVRQIASGPNNTVWITMEEPGESIYEVGRISGLEPPVVAPPAPKSPETTLDKGPKKVVKTKKKTAKVSFRFSSSSAGASFECALTKVKKGKKPAAAKFAGCTSPRKYTLKPGRYRFSVRAVSAALVDASPATTTFKVVKVKRHKVPKKR